MVTEKQCEKAFSDLLVARYVFKQETEKYADDSLMRRFNKAVHTFARLIDEHFSNPSLSWDELKIAEPVFDDEEFGWVFIKYKDPSSKQLEYVDVDGNTGWMDYKENRFYKKEPASIATGEGD